MAVITTYQAPFGGINVSAPENVISRQDAEQCDNFMLRENFIATRPSFTQLFSGVPSGKSIIGLMQGSQPGTSGFTPNPLKMFYVVTQDDLYYYDLGTLHLNGSIGPNCEFVDYLNALSSTIFVTGKVGVMQVITINTPVDLTGGLFGSYFIMELAQNLIIANTIEGTSRFPQRIRWPDQTSIFFWDPFAHTGAGFVDLLDCSDVITGMLPMGSVGYILRSNGITQVTPTGNGIQPWYFNHLWAAEHGIGQLFAGAKAQYGGLAFLVAEDNVYVFTPSGINTVGDKVIHEIIEDIYTYAGAANFAGNAMSPFFNGVCASLYPRYSGNYRYFVYKLFIINESGTPQGVCWSYDLDLKAWTREVYTDVAIATKPEYIYLPGQVDNLCWGQNGPGTHVVNFFDPTKLDTEQDAVYAFKSEAQQDLNYKEVSWVSVRYTNIGKGDLTVTIDCQAGPQAITLTLGDNTKDKTYYNGMQQPLALADGKSYYALYSFHPVTDSSFQVILSRLANSGPLKIEEVQVFGESAEVSR